MDKNLLKLFYCFQTNSGRMRLAGKRLKQARFVLCSALLFLFACSAKVSAQGLPELMYFRFDVTGTSIPNEAVTATRVSTTGTLTTNTIGGTGQFGTALLGNGGTGNSFSANWPLNLSGPWTISMWFSGVTNALSSNYMFGGSGGTTFRALTGSGVVAGAGNLEIRGTGLTDIFAYNVFDATGTPVVVTVVYDPAALISRTYVNGLPATTSPTTVQPSGITMTGTDFTIGNYATSAGLNSGGKMDEFRLYNRALTATEIAATWNQPLPIASGACSSTPSAPVITTAAQTAPICNSTVSLTGTNPNTNTGITLQWEQAPSATGPWTSVVGGTGATTLSYTSPAITTNTWYRLTAICTASSLSSSSAAYAVAVGMPQPGAITGSNTFCPGGTYTYSVPAASIPATYTWTLPSGWSGTSTTNSISALTSGSTGGTVSVTATSSCGTSIAQTMAVTLGAVAPTPGIITGNTTVCSGAVQNYSVAPVAGATSYNWVLPAGWSGSSTGNVITVTPGNGGGNISVSAVNNCGTSALQTMAVATTTQPLTTGAITGETVVCPNIAKTYSVIRIPGALSYTWQTPAGWIGSSNTDTLNISSIPASGIIRVTANNGCQGAVPSLLTVTLLPTLTPALSILASDTVICSGSQVTFTPNALNGGAAPAIQWYRNGLPIATGTTYNPTNLATGDMITATLTSNYQCLSTPTANSNSVRIRVNPTVTSGVNVNSNRTDTSCSGQAITFTANAIGGGTTPDYQWMVNGTPVGTNSLTYTRTTPLNGDSVYVVLTSSEICVTQRALPSNKIRLNIFQPSAPAVTITANPGTNISSGQTVLFTASSVNGGSAPKYQWMKNNVNITGATGASYTTDKLENGDQISVQMGSTKPCADPLVVGSNRMKFNVIPTGINIVSGNGISLTLAPNPNNGRFTLTAVWEPSMNGKPVQLEVVNALGQLIYTSNVTAGTGTWHQDISLQDVPAGIYILKVNDGKGQAMQRFMIK